MAHGDFVDPIAKEGAEEVLQLMFEVYQSRVRLSKRKAARLAKSTQKPQGTPKKH